MEYNFLQVVPESKKDSKYYESWDDFILSRFNSQRLRTGDYAGAYIENVGQQAPSQGVSDQYSNPISIIQRNKRYYANMQGNEKFGFIGRTLSNEATPIGVSWQRVPKITQLMNDLEGEMSRSLNYYDMYAESTSPSAQNEKTNKLKLTRIKVENKELFQELEDLGISFSTLGGVEEQFQTMDEVEAYMDNDYKTQVEVLAEMIKTDIIRRNGGSSFNKKAILEAAIAGICCAEVTIENGKTKWNLYDADRVIWDNSRDRVIHDDFRYIGLIDYKTPAEVLEEFGDELRETEEGRKAILEIEKITTAKTINTSAAGMFMTGMSSNIPLIAVTKNYWSAYKKDDGEQYLTYYKSTRIADIISVGNGECTNLVESYKDVKKVFPPVVLYTPDMVNGMAGSFVSKMVDYSDLIDFYKNKLNTYVARSQGRVGLILGETLQDQDYIDMYNNWSKFGVASTNTANGDEYNDKTQRIMEFFDTSNYQEMELLMRLIKEEEKWMEAITSANDITLGQQSQYVSANAQRQTIDQAKKAVYSFYDGFLKFLEQLVTVSVNIEKDQIAINNDNYAIPFVSKFGKEFLKKIKYLTLEDFRIRFKFIDPITEESRKVIMGYIEREVSNPNGFITPEDFANALSIKTVTGLQKYFSKITKRVTKQREQQEEIALNQQQLAQQQEANKDITKESIAADAKVQTAEIKSETDLAKQMM
jgi:hypothetical protein